MPFGILGLIPITTCVRIRFFLTLTPGRTGGVWTSTQAQSMGDGAPHDPSAEKRLGPYWSTISGRRAHKPPNLAIIAELSRVAAPARPLRKRPKPPAAPPERVQREKPPPPVVHITQHIYLGSNMSESPQIAPSGPVSLLGSKAKPSKWHHGPTAKVLAAADAAQRERAAEWRSQLSTSPSCRPTSPLLLLQGDQSALLASPPALPTAIAVPITALDISIPVVSELVPLTTAPLTPLAPSATVHTSSPPLSAADTPPPGTIPALTVDAPSPRVIFTGGKRQRNGDLLRLSQLPAIAAAYSPMRAKAARKAACIPTSTSHTTGQQVELKVRHELEARAARLERFGCVGAARATRAQLAAMPAPQRDTATLFAPPARPTAPLPFPADRRHVGSETSRARPPSSDRLLEVDESDFSSGLDLLPPGEQRARLAAINAACDLVPLMEVWQAARILGRPMADIRREDPRVVTADLVRVFGFGWSAGTLKNVAREWCNLRDFAFAPLASGAPRVPAGQEIPGAVVDRFLSARHDNAVRKSITKFRRLGVDPPRGHAGGHAAKGALATAIKFMKKRCYFRIDISSTAVARSFETARRTAGTPAPSLNPRNAFCLSEQAEHGGSEFVRGHAGGHYAGAQFALRQVNAQRAHIVSIANGVVFGEVDLDAKQKSTQQRGRPMWTPERDARGRNSWLTSIATMLTAHPSVIGQHFFVRATNSPDGNPFNATAWGEGPETAGRSRISLCALLQAGPYGVPAAIARAITGHSSKHLLPNVGRSLHLTDPQINEIGRWSGSRAQNTAASGAPSREVQVGPCPAAYSTEAAEEVVPAIMETVVASLRELHARLPANALPHVGGWSMLRHPAA